MNKNPFPFVIAAITLTLSLSSCTPKKDVNTFEAMNTLMTIQCYTSNPVKINKQVQERILYLEDLISTTKQTSDIYKINNRQGQTSEQQQGQTFLVHPETFQLIEFACCMAEKTNGALNPALYPVTSAWGFTTGNYHVPSDSEIRQLLTYTDFARIVLNSENYSVFTQENMMLDLGAVGKGFAGDQAIELMKSKGVKSALLDLGGNIQTLGSKPDGSFWTIGIKSPWGGNPVAGLRISNQAVITSGGYERYFTGDDNRNYIHIFDGNTGRPVENDIASITIVCNSGLYGDSLSTALFVMGARKAIEYWRKNPDFEFILIKNDGTLIYTKGLAQSINLMADFSYIQVIE